MGARGLKWVSEGIRGGSPSRSEGEVSAWSNHPRTRRQPAARPARRHRATSVHRRHARAARRRQGPASSCRPAPGAAPSTAGACVALYRGCLAVWTQAQLRRLPRARSPSRSAPACVPARLPRGVPSRGHGHHRRPGPPDLPPADAGGVGASAATAERGRRGPGRPPRDPAPAPRTAVPTPSSSTTSSTSSTTADRPANHEREAQTAEEHDQERHEDGGEGFAHPLSSGWQMDSAPTPPAEPSARSGRHPDGAAIRGAADGRDLATATYRRRGIWHAEGGTTFEHRPVMVAEVVEALAPVPPGVVLDATVGGGGHAGRPARRAPAPRARRHRPRRRRPRSRRRRPASLRRSRATLRRARFDQLTRIL